LRSTPKTSLESFAFAVAPRVGAVSAATTNRS
jgi:hypothetical protein